MKLRVFWLRTRRGETVVAAVSIELMFKVESSDWFYAPNDSVWIDIVALVEALIDRSFFAFLIVGTKRYQQAIRSSTADWIGDRFLLPGIDSSGSTGAVVFSISSIISA